MNIEQLRKIRVELANANVKTQDKPYKTKVDNEDGEFDFKSYDWDTCISDNEPKYGAKGAAKVCGAIKAMNASEEFMIPKPEAGEDKKDFITRCMKAIGGEDKPEEQKLAICYAQIEHKDEMKDAHDPCWEGYEQVGTKMLNGKEVPNCVPIKKK